MKKKRNQQKEQSRNSVVDPSISMVFDFITQDKAKELEDYILDENNEIWNIKRGDNINPLHNACVLEKYNLLEIIIEKTKIRLGLNNINANGEEITRNKKIFEDFINSTTESDSLTPLHYASFRGNLKIIKLLIENGAKVDSVSNHGINMIHKAAQGNKPSAIIYFNKKYNLAIEATDENQLNALHLATISGMENSAIYLLSLGINPNKQDKNGLTALHYAVKFNQKRIIKKLLQKGADVTIKDKKGKTPPELAKRNPEIQEIFRKKGICEKLFFRPDITQKNCWTNKNMILFIILHIFIIFSNFFILLPICGTYYLSLAFLIASIIVFILYFWLSFSNPGRMKNTRYDDILDIVESNEDIADYCPYCLVKKTYRSLHCLICNHCIDDFDHHCFWVGNCVGKKNYYLFFTFLVYVLSNSVFNLTINLIYFIHFGKKSPDTNNPLPGKIFGNSFFLYEPNIGVIVAFTCFFICISFFIPLVSLFRMQCSTAIEKRQIKRDEKEYEKNQLREKFDEEVWEDLEYDSIDEEENHEQIELKDN